ncbi:ATP-binding cassette domain-containing protein, partial [Kineococcus sp. R8]|uniref:ABC transporter transmembrane domain-containing protein n=1 Tax=Kineococcus siccus TaxID=2696567 RepID=UPI001412E072|nr:ATP-binding cassette domain-containing protein [Kineococcus siccus]
MLVPLLRQHLRPHRSLLAGVVVLQLLQATATLYLPRLNADVIDRGVATGDTGYVLRTGGTMLVVTLLQVLCAVGAVLLGARTAMAVGRDLRAAVFGHVLDLSQREVGRFGAPSLITRCTNDVQQVQVLVLVVCTLLVSAPLLIVGGVVMALREDVGLSWLLVVAVPVLVAAVAAIMVRLGPLFRVLQGRVDTVNRVLREQLTGIRVVRSFVREAAETQRFAAANADLTQTATHTGRLFALVFPVVTLVLNGASVAVIWFGAPRVESGDLQVGSLIAFLSYLVQILTAVLMSTFIAVLAPRAAVSADRIAEVLATAPSVVLPAAPTTPADSRGTVELRDVSFAYPGAELPVLSGVSCTAAPGRLTAVIGSTGAGKTTLVNLLGRLFDATGGSVVLDGVDVRELSDAELRRRVGLVPQKAYLFAGTVASNLRFGRPEATDEELWAALRTAQAADFVAAMPGGLE